MKNKKIIIIAVVITIIALAVYFWLKAKKKKSVVASTTSDVNSNIAASATAVKQNQVPVVPINTPPAASPATQTQPFSSSQTPAPAASVPVFKYLDVVRDGSKGTAILMYQPLSRNFSIGESVRILTGPYAGTHKIWYIYNYSSGGKMAGPGQNLYLETPYKQSDSGEFSKA